ncbi:hypothetical protein N7414_23050 [Pseudomonas sp. GD04087]|uniref:hypothetical protein n=1 Tax=unclassified Pseudomonas TaxID=196821 RepID=UPI0024473A8F|nr:MULTISPECIES: hypothetical protein [unclassified Pseudomonas]MDH0292012.1 hypothetical protein [Pseudomonas sp. GD04087]MDH1052860.1 hypothetical protein [Pseudomonas sp. GD03903]MDH2002023.1 hypothetical protein [Pseudomonas sp. GD03691]
MDPVSYLLSGAVLVAALVFLSRQITLHWLSKDIERHKEQLKGESALQLKQLEHQLRLDSDATASRLKQQAEIEISRLQASLKLRTDQRQLRFAWYYQKQAETITESMRLIADMRVAAEKFLTPAPEFIEASKLEGYYKSATDALNALRHHHEATQIFLPPDTARQVKTLRRMVGDMVHPAGTWAFSVRDPGYEKEIRSAWMTGWRGIMGEARVAQDALEDAFRALLESEAEPN